MKNTRMMKKTRTMKNNSLSKTKLYPTPPDGGLFAGYEGDGHCRKPTAWKSGRGVALLLTLVILMVLTTITYSLTSRVAQVKHRRQYLMDYQVSRYACDSGTKYALSAIKKMDFKLIDRRDKPDFSDLFTMNRQEYELYLDEWAQKLAQEDALENAYGTANGTAKNSSGENEDLIALLEESGINIDPNLLTTDYSEPNVLFVPGPYGPRWPNVCEPIKFDIGQTNVTIEITDENAKMPLTWLISDNDKVRKLALDALDMFGSWMQMDPVDVMNLAEQLEDIEDIKRFTTKPKPISVGRRVRGKRNKTLPITVHTTDFAKLMHGSSIDFEVLTRPLPDTGDRYESPLKYLALWGSHKVNINTAPRHVLEAVFTFGGEAEYVAEEIIQRRHEKPFKDIKELQDSLYRYSESIKKSKDYITTSSTFFAIKITAAYGRVKTWAVATVIKQGKKVQPIAVISRL